ncbi:hypothetical protein ACFOGJ_16925 [Marinibaculum pumilum]|uniref:Nicotinamide riboside transporter PnuC n=1 Tax=Marinibaculum pumilum TaxID=1766165 RepID=A0ABV7L3I3_9PROT
MELLEILQWGACISGTIAAIMVASRISDRITGYGFAVFTLSSVLWVSSGLMDATYSLAVQNGVLFAINVWGVWRWLISDSMAARRGAAGQAPSADSA